MLKHSYSQTTGEPAPGSVFSGTDAPGSGSRRTMNAVIQQQAADMEPLAGGPLTTDFEHTRQLVKFFLEAGLNRNPFPAWSYQGLGMLRLYVTQETRLHVWSPSRAVKDVSTLHTHPWDFESLVVSGTIYNGRYEEYPLTAPDAKPGEMYHETFDEHGAVGKLDLDQHFEAAVSSARTGATDHGSIEARGAKVWHPANRGSIICGPGGGLDASQSRETFLSRSDTEVFDQGERYYQLAEEIHESKPTEGAITLVTRKVPAGRSADHAYVYWNRGESWVSAEPRPARVSEVEAFCREALNRW